MEFRKHFIREAFLGRSLNGLCAREHTGYLICPDELNFVFEDP